MGCSSASFCNTSSPVAYWPFFFVFLALSMPSSRTKLHLVVWVNWDWTPRRESMNTSRWTPSISFPNSSDILVSAGTSGFTPSVSISASTSANGISIRQQSLNVRVFPVLVCIGLRINKPMSARSQAFFMISLTGRQCNTGKLLAENEKSCEASASIK